METVVDYSLLAWLQRHFPDLTREKWQRLHQEVMQPDPAEVEIVALEQQAAQLEKQQ